MINNLFNKGWKPPPTKKPAAKIVAQWNPGSIFGSEPNSTIIGGDDIFTTQAVNVTTTSTTTTMSTVETVNIDYQMLPEPTEPTTTVTTTTVDDKITELEDNETVQDFDDRFDFDESLFANDFVAPVYEEEEEIERSPEVEKVAEMSKKSKNVEKVAEMSVQRDIVDENQQLDLASSLGLQNEKAVTINIFNNQVYNQNASDGARLVNNHGQDLTFGNKIGQSGVIPPGANMGARGQLRTMQHMVEQLVHSGGDDDLMREV